MAIDPDIGKGVELGTRRSDDYPERVRRYLDQQAKDAARYRFIKSHFKPEYGDIADYWVLNGAVETAFDDLTTLDSAIDATMKDEVFKDGPWMRVDDQQAKDAERLDWLEKQQDVTWQSSKGVWSGTDGLSLRSAIDQAMKDESQKSLDKQA